MEIQVNKLREALALLEPVVPKKPTIEVLVNARLGDGKAVATDLEAAVSVSLPEAQDAILLPLKEAMQFLKFAPGFQRAQVAQESSQVKISVGSMETSLNTKKAQDYPPIPQVQAEGEGVLDGDALVKAMEAVLPYATTDNARPVLNGICLTLGENVEVAGADGFRLAWETVPGKLGTEGKLIIPSNTVKVLGQLWKKGATPDLTGAADPASIALAKRFIRFGWQNSRAQLEMRFGGITLLTRLVQGTFPTYSQLVPTDNSCSVTVYGEDIVPALEQVKRLAKDTSGIVRLVWESDRLRVAAHAESVGQTTVSIPARSSAPGKTAVTIGYLLEYFRGKGEVTMSTANERSPILFTHRGTPHVVIMPMFVDWTGKGETPPPEPEGPPDDLETGDPQDEPGAGPQPDSLGPENSPPAPKPRRRSRKTQ